ncbi:MAG TPA: SusC/RagA family TonB-linked outer membrane protein [Gemmatimonadaceae bacterium]|nr:SusC/RagA family TonB-linked outer membrane protein [Gemmatimonadaceae bacterium]
MKRIVGIVVALLAFAFLPASVMAQGSGTISGRVIDQATQAPVQAAQVVIVGTQRGAMTDQDGRYTITGVPAGTHELRVRRVGYGSTTQSVTVSDGGTATAEFSLATSATRLEEVVVNAVTGQEQRRVENGTNTGFIGVADLPKGPITKMADVLQGRVAGVTLQSVGGATGSGQRVRIRGANSISLSNEPLLYVDGVLVSNGKGGISVGGGDYSRLNDLNVEEIEDIEVLKGPAASAIYGSAAANGVLLITTKKGRVGAPVWRAYAEVGQTKDKNDYPLNFAALRRTVPGSTTEEFYCLPASGCDNPFDWVLFTTALFGPSAPFATCHNYQAALAAGTTGACTQDEVISFDFFRDDRTSPFVSGSRDKLGIGVSGGGDALTYFISGDREAENGVLRPNNLERVSLRSNLNARIGGSATAAVTAAYITSKHRRLGSDNNIFSPLIIGLTGPAQYLPGMETDTVGVAVGRAGSLFGPNYLDNQNFFADQFVDRFIIGANTNVTPRTWLRLNANAGLDYYGRSDEQGLDPNILPIGGEFDVGFRDVFRSNNYEWTSHASATGTFNPLTSLISTTTLGGSFGRSLFQQVECFGQAIPAGTKSCAAATTQFAVDETREELKTIGAFLRQELAFADRVFLSGSLRADNNSGLVRDVSGLSYYPSLNASWLMSDESFFPRAGFLSQFRLRAAWGRAGTRPGYGQAESLFGSRAIQRVGAETPALILTGTGNPALKVEKTTELEGGFDLGMFDNRVSAEFTAYTRSSKDALIQRNLAPSTGLTANVFQNLGEIENSGTEMGLNIQAIQSERVGLDIRFTASTLKNRIVELGEDIAPIQINRGRQQHREGFSAGGYFALPIKYNDANGDGKLSVAEVSVDTSKFLIVRNEAGGLDTLRLAFVGPLLPTNTQGLSMNLTLFKNLTISSLFERRGGNKQMNETEYFRCRTQHSNPFFGFCGAISNPNASLASQAAFIGSQFAQFGATPYGYMEDASFVKFRELAVRFGVPEGVGSRAGFLSGAAITLSGRNLKTWTDYTGLDPEINEGGGNAFTQAEFNTQPPVRTFNLRLDLKF